MTVRNSNFCLLRRVSFTASNDQLSVKLAGLLCQSKLKERKLGEARKSFKT
jgi:hypothetical protein